MASSEAVLQRFATAIDSGGAIEATYDEVLRALREDEQDALVAAVVSSGLQQPFIARCQGDLQPSANTSVANATLKLLGFFSYHEKLSASIQTEDALQLMDALCALVHGGTSDKRTVNLALWCLSVQKFPSAAVVAKLRRLLEALAVVATDPPSGSSALVHEALVVTETLLSRFPVEMATHALVWGAYCLPRLIDPLAKLREKCIVVVRAGLPLLVSARDGLAKQVLAIARTAVGTGTPADDPADVGHFQAPAGCATFASLGAEGRFQQALEVWALLVPLLGEQLHRGSFINELLKLPERAFLAQSPAVRVCAYASWNALADNFAAAPDGDLLARPKRLTLALAPMKQQVAHEKHPAVLESLIRAWWHVAVELDAKLPSVYADVVAPLLDATLAPSQDSPQRWSLEQMGLEMAAKLLAPQQALSYAGSGSTEAGSPHVTAPQPPMTPVTGASMSAAASGRDQNALARAPSATPPTPVTPSGARDALEPLRFAWVMENIQLVLDIGPRLVRYHRDALQSGGHESKWLSRTWELLCDRLGVLLARLHSASKQWASLREDGEDSASAASFAGHKDALASLITSIIELIESGRAPGADVSSATKIDSLIGIAAALTARIDPSELCAPRLFDWPAVTAPASPAVKARALASGQSSPKAERHLPRDMSPKSSPRSSPSKKSAPAPRSPFSGPAGVRASLCARVFDAVVRYPVEAMSRTVAGALLRSIDAIVHASMHAPPVPVDGLVHCLLFCRSLAAAIESAPCDAQEHTGARDRFALAVWSSVARALRSFVLQTDCVALDQSPLSPALAQRPDYRAVVACAVLPALILSSGDVEHWRIARDAAQADAEDADGPLEGLSSASLVRRCAKLATHVYGAFATVASARDPQPNAAAHEVSSILHDVVRGVADGAPAVAATEFASEVVLAVVNAADFSKPDGHGVANLQSLIALLATLTTDCLDVPQSAGERCVGLIFDAWNALFSRTQHLSMLTHATNAAAAVVPRLVLSPFGESRRASVLLAAFEERFARIVGSTQSGFDSAALRLASPLLSSALSHPRKDVRSDAVSFWNSTFGKGTSSLSMSDVPSTLLECLLRLHKEGAVALPGALSQTAAKAADALDTPRSPAGVLSESQSQGDAIEEPFVSLVSTASPRRARGSFMSRLADVASPVKTRTSSPTRTSTGRPVVSVSSPPGRSSPSVARKRPAPAEDSLDDSMFVRIAPIADASAKKRRLLTERQRETRGTAAAVPAMYSALDQSQDPFAFANYAAQTQMSESQGDAPPQPHVAVAPAADPALLAVPPVQGSTTADVQMRDELAPVDADDARQVANEDMADPEATLPPHSPVPLIAPSEDAMHADDAAPESVDVSAVVDPSAMADATGPIEVVHSPPPPTHGAADDMADALRSPPAGNDRSAATLVSPGILKRPQSGSGDRNTSPKLRHVSFDLNSNQHFEIPRDPSSDNAAQEQATVPEAQPALSESVAENTGPASPLRSPPLRATRFVLHTDHALRRAASLLGPAALTPDQSTKRKATDEPALADARPSKVPRVSPPEPEPSVVAPTGGKDDGDSADALLCPSLTSSSRAIDHVGGLARPLRRLLVGNGISTVGQLSALTPRRMQAMNLQQWVEPVRRALSSLSESVASELERRKATAMVTLAAAVDGASEGSASHSSQSDVSSQEQERASTAEPKWVPFSPNGDSDESDRDANVERRIQRSLGPSMDAALTDGVGCNLAASDVEMALQEASQCIADVRAIDGELAQSTTGPLPSHATVQDVVEAPVALEATRDSMLELLERARRTEGSVSLMSASELIAAQQHLALLMTSVVSALARQSGAPT